MKKFYLFLVFALGATISKSQVAEVFGFPTFTSPQDYTIVTPDNLFNNKYYYLANDNSKRTYLYYIEEENLPVQVAEVSFNPAGGTGLTAAIVTEFKATETLLYFVTRTLQSGSTFQYELWRTDGTAAGTFRLMYYGGASTAVPIRINSTLKKTNAISDNSLSGGILFVASATGGTRSIWKTDGTVAGTVVVKNIITTNGNSYNQNQVIEKIGSNFIFTLYNETTFQLELWKTDGITSSNLTDGAGAVQTVIKYIGKLGNKIYYYRGGPTSVYSTDGIIATKEFDTPEVITDAFIHNNTDYYYLSQTVATENFKLYHVTGDISNKVLIASITGIYTIDYANNEGVILKKSESFGTVFRQFFVTKTGVVTENTNPLKPTEFHNYNGDTYAGAELYTDPTLIGKEIWKYNAPTSVLVQDIYTGSFAGLANSSTPKYFFQQNQNLYFVANVSSGRKLYTIRRDFTFNGSTNSLWNVPSNWNTSSIPAKTNNVIIPAGYTPEITTNSFAKNISVASPVNITSGNLDIYGNATLSNDAKITLNTNNLNLKGTSSTLTGNETSYIVTNSTGSLQIENIGASGRSGEIAFPIGTSVNYAPAYITNTGINDVFNARVVENLYNTYSGEIPGGTQYTTGAVGNTWFINEGVAGSSNVELKLQWNQSQELPSFNRTQTHLGHFTGGSWNLGTVGGASGSNPYTFSRTGITSLSPFGIMNNNGTLPLNFLSFSTQKCNNNQVCLIWKTANEQNVSHFEIERGTDGINFTTIAIKNANNQPQNTYTYIDDISTLQNSKKIYYRIKEVDNDGRSKQSNINLIQLDNKGVLVYPSFVTSLLTVQNNSNTIMQLQLIGIDGRIVLQQVIAEGTNLVSIGKLTAGIYVYSVVGADKRVEASGKISKQ